MIEIINNFFNEIELDVIQSSMDKCNWKLTGFLERDTDNRYFWHKIIKETSAFEIFANKIKSTFDRSIIIDRLYVNGQTHGQNGFWHTDVPVNSINCYSIVYFNKPWLPEYGGHLLIKSDHVVSIIPEFNKAVLFNSTIEHMGLEPTVHCRTMRESIACKFRVINE